MNGLVFGSLLMSAGGFAGDSEEHAGARNVGAYIRQMDPVALPHFSRLLRGTRQGVDQEADFTYALDLLLRGLTAARPAG
ncbi:hypothetical protein [Nonomuraea sp. NPDC050643]|uniref:hypothetical protein n=1 Tax=Nonomuraea sp. NPDC050643 TaxID=3155660 RepID=UPI00340443EC